MLKEFYAVSSCLPTFPNAVVLHIGCTVELSGKLFKILSLKYLKSSLGDSNMLNYLVSESVTT